MTTKTTAAPLAVGYAAAATVAFGVATAVGDGWPSPLTLAFFVAVILWAKHGAVLLPSNIDVSPSFMVVMAAIAAFDERGLVLGAAVVGGCSGLTLTTLRERRFGALVVNCSQYALSAMAAAFAYELSLGRAPSIVRVALTGVAFGVVNVGLVLPATVVLSG